LSKEIVETERAYFAPIAEEKKVVETPVSPITLAVDEMSQVLSMLEADKITALNNYHMSLLNEMIDKVQSDIQLLTKYSK